MADRIKHVSDLPKWFQLEKYSKAKDLDANGWYEQLNFRASFLWHFDAEEDSDRKKIIHIADFKEAIEAIREKPIYNMKVDGKLPLFFYFESIPISLKAKSPYLIPSMQVMSLLDFDLLRRELDPEKLEYVKNWENQFHADELPFIPPYIYKSWIKQPIYHSLRQDLKENLNYSGREPVMIDFNYPDKVLIENFKNFITARRAELKKEHLAKPVRQCNFSDWIRYGALPYLDLKIWELEANIKIPHRVFADAIYPRGEGGEETVRKTTISLANSLITDELLRQLVAEAAIDLAEQNNN